MLVNSPPAHGSSVGAKIAPASLVEMVTVEALQALQDRFSALGKVTVCIRTVDGVPITHPTWGSRFSELIGTSPRGRILFAEQMRASALRAGSRARPIRHDGMAFYATRIVHDKRHLATIVVGTRASDSLDPETLQGFATRYDIDYEELLDTASRVDPYKGGSPEAIHDFADVLADTIASLYGQGDRIRRQLHDLRTVHEFTDLLSGPRELQEILDLTVRRVVEVMAVKACAIRLLNAQTGELVIKAVHNLSEEYLRKGPVLIAENAIDAAVFAGETVYIEDAPNDPRLRYPQNAKREGIVSGLCVPMSYRGQAIGVLRVYTGQRYKFSRSEELLLHSIGAQAAAAIITGRLHREYADNERVQRQMEAAAQIQRRMLPSEPPQHEHLEFGCIYDATLELGGDFYDFIEYPDGCLGLCIADVVGKGLPAALMMASVRSALRGYAQPGDEVDTVMARVNRHMCRDTLSGEFATLVYGVFSPDGRTFTYSNAGHESPLLLRDGDFIELDRGGLVIGVQPDETFDHGVVELRSGDILVFVTDGVFEAMDFQGRAFGRERLRSSIQKHRALDAAQLAHQILWDVRRFVGLADQSDDITIVVVKALNGPAEAPVAQPTSSDEYGDS